MQFESQSDLLESFKRLTLHSKKLKIVKRRSQTIKEDIKRKGSFQRRKIQRLKEIRRRRMEIRHHDKRQLSVITVKKSDTWPLRAHIRERPKEGVIDAVQPAICRRTAKEKSRNLSRRAS